MNVTSVLKPAKSAVLFIIFNRPDTTKQVFDRIRAAKPPRLYVAADGPRQSKPHEKDLCVAARAVVSEIDWACEVKTLFRDENLGCKNAVSSAIDWFFEHEEEGIILEDDCLPAASFFNFCDTLLEKYRYDTRIRHITGCNLQQGKKWGADTYYFSNMTHVWGWAGWRRVWKDYDKTLNKYNTEDVSNKLSNIFDDQLIVSSLKHIFDEVKAGKIDTWDYQLDFANLFYIVLSIIPNENLISNIGFGSNATHTTDNNSLYSNITLKEIGEITHPGYFLPEKQADLLVLKQVFNANGKKRKESPISKKVKKWAKSAFPQAATFVIF